MTYKVQLIKEEIEKRKQLIWPTNTGEMKVVDTPKPLVQGWLNALNWVLNIIDSLPLEESTNEDLKKEISKCYKSRNDLMMTREQFGKIIRHFTEWQKQQLINKACEWLNDWLESDDFGIPITASSRKLFLKEFKEAMEEQQ